MEVLRLRVVLPTPPSERPPLEGPPLEGPGGGAAAAGAAPGAVNEPGETGASEDVGAAPGRRSAPEIDAERAATGAKEAEAADAEEDRYWRKIGRAKRRSRSELQQDGDWVRDRYWTTYGACWAADDRVPRIDYDAVSEAEFVERYECPAVPVVIRGAADHWPAATRWSVENLAANYGKRRFKVGEDDHGNSVRLKLGYFLRYAATTVDDSPLYVFDGSFGDRMGSSTLLDDYEVPKYFRDDLFRLAGERRRPPYRWIVIGPARSGTNIHIDPLGTSAWNTLLHGHKRWVLFPPGTPKADLQTPKGDSEAVAWFMKVYPRTRAPVRPPWRGKAPEWPHAPPMDLLQHPGETVFVPGGWWHVVMNLDMTVAVTQNFCSRTNFNLVWVRTRTSRRKFSAKLLERLQTEYPTLYQQALALNDDPDSAARYGGPGGYGDDSSSSSSSSSSSEDDDADEDGSDCDCAECRARTEIKRDRSPAADEPDAPDAPDGLGGSKRARPDPGASPTSLGRDPVA